MEKQFSIDQQHNQVILKSRVYLGRASPFFSFLWG